MAPPRCPYQESYLVTSAGSPIRLRATPSTSGPFATPRRSSIFNGAQKSLRSYLNWLGASWFMVQCEAPKISQISSVPPQSPPHQKTGF